MQRKSCKSSRPSGLKSLLYPLPRLIALLRDELPSSDEDNAAQGRTDRGGDCDVDLDEWWAQRRGGGGCSQFRAPREVDFSDHSVPKHVGCPGAMLCNSLLMQIGKEFMDAAKNGNQ
eukprot:51234-Hanusia_phi.AAC.1